MMAEYSKNLGEGKKVVSSNDKNSESNILNIESSTLTPLDDGSNANAKDIPEKEVAKEKEAGKENTT
jgi:hypothetical protein